MKQLWTEQYRPNTLEGYVFRDNSQKEQVKGWIKDGIIPHLLFSGEPGTGKTTIAKILINLLEVNDFDVLTINGSSENGVEILREKITSFVSTMPFGDFKIVLFDEADYITHSAQAALRNLMETYSSTARFILTCNLPNKIMPALHSRCQGFHIEKIDQTEFTARIAEILINENVEFDIDTLDTYVKATYPDLRKCINNCQMNSSDGKLSAVSGDEGGMSDYKFRAVELFKGGRIKEAREVICNISTHDIEGVYKWMYNNLDLFGTTDEEKDKAILSIRDGLVNHSFVADPEINLSATLIELTTS
jgi:DNA polymerase III delta prime subunit